jgi:hypothetical protein
MGEDIEFNAVLTGKEMTHLILVLGHHAKRTGSMSSQMLRIKLQETIDNIENVRR